MMTLATHFRMEGREEGREEGRMDIAKKMLVNKVPNDIIYKCTRLTKMELGALKRSLEKEQLVSN